MEYRTSNAPLIFASGVASAVVLGFLGAQIWVSSWHNSARAAVLECARDHGLKGIDWQRVAGFHDFNIGEEFVADSPEGKAALRCMLASPELRIEASPNTPCNNHPSLIFWRRQKMFESPALTYYPAHSCKGNTKDE